MRVFIALPVAVAAFIAVIVFHNGVENRAISAEPAQHNWHSDIHAAFKAAQSSGRPLFLFVSSENCRYCRKMTSNTLKHPVIQEYIETRYEPLVITAEKHTELIKKLGVRNFPTTLVITPQAKINNVIEGYLAPTAFRTRLGRR